MKRVMYTGMSDAQIFDAADLAKAGVEGFRKTTFPNGVPVEVDDQVADLLVGTDDPIFGGFSFELFSEEVEDDLGSAPIEGSTETEVVDDSEEPQSTSESVPESVELGEGPMDENPIDEIPGEEVKPKAKGTKKAKS